MPAETSPGARSVGRSGTTQPAGLETTVKEEVVERSVAQPLKMASTYHSAAPFASWMLLTCGVDDVPRSSPFTYSLYDDAPASLHSKLTGAVTAVLPSIGLASSGRTLLLQFAAGA